MDVHDDQIPDESFAAFLDTMPQVSVEIVLERDGSVLLVKRTNEPAKGEWFWPGTRLYKGESFEHAVRRLARKELGIEVTIHSQVGVCNHFWETANLPSVESTHTVNVVYHGRPAGDIGELTLDDQHDEYRFIDRIAPTLHEHVRRYLNESGILDHRV
jgi:colanic acid biosynthesis protein WcaH